MARAPGSHDPPKPIKSNRQKVKSMLAKKLIRAMIRGAIRLGYRNLHVVRLRNQYMVLEREVSLNRVLKRVCPDGVVLGGPFSGLKYPQMQAWGSVLAPKLLGTYEKELHAILNRLDYERYSVIIDIGAAEGYYAVGLARKAPHAMVVAFECDPGGQALLRQMAELNGVQERVRVLGHCDAGELARVSTAAEGLIVCDCEGAEDQIFGPPFLPNVLGFDLLIETHDFLVSGVNRRLQERFQSTHRVTVILSVERFEADFPALGHEYRFEKLYALHEGRPCPMQWLWLESKLRTSSPPCGERSFKAVVS